MNFNQTTSLDEDGYYSDWIEIYNDGAAPVNLNGYGLSNDPLQPLQWTFPDVTIEAGSFLIVWASGMDRKIVDPVSKPQLQMDIYRDIPGDYIIDFTSHPSFPDKPSNRYYLENGFHLPENLGDNFGVRIQGHFIAPQDGHYIFRITGDNQCKLFLSLSDSPSDTILIAEIPDWTHPWDYFKYPTQFSSPIHLEAGEKYYLLGLMKDGCCSDHFRVAWQLPDSSYQDPLPGSIFTRESMGLHTNFKLDSIGSVIQLSSPGGIILDQLPIVELRPDVSYGRTPNGADNLVYFDNPTPLGSNGSGTQGVLSPVVFNKNGFLFDSNFILELEHSEPDVQIYYTDDGSVPSNENGNLYSTPFQISFSKVIRAIAVKPGFLHSDIKSEVYTKVDNNLNSFSSDIPIIIVHQFNQISHTESPVFNYMTVLNNQGMDRVYLLDDYEIQRRVNILNYHKIETNLKNSYEVEILNEDGSSRKDVVLGMPEESSWLLYAPYSDKTLMRDVLAFDYNRDLGAYAPGAKFVEVFVHQGFGPISMDYYQGVYVMMEKIKIAPGRQNLEVLEPYHHSEPEITGGYILKKDTERLGDFGISTSRFSPLLFVSPTHKELTPTQNDWIKSYFNDWESTLFGSDFLNPANGYRKFIDVDNFIDYHLITEVFKSVDAFKENTFIQKDRNEKMKMGPIWNYRHSLGNANSLGAWSPEEWQHRNLTEYEYLYGWYTRLFEDEEFLNAYKQRYRSLRQNKLSTPYFLNKIDTYATYLAESQQRNFEKHNILGVNVWPNFYVGNSYEDEVNYMKEWITARLEWMDTALEIPINTPLVHYWNFNNPSDIENPSFTVGGGKLEFDPDNQAETSIENNSEFIGANSRLGDIPGTQLRLNSPELLSSIYRLPTTQYSKLLFKYETACPEGLSGKQYLSYSINGSDFIPFDTVSVSAEPLVYRYDFWGTAGVDDNEDFAIKITKDQEPDGSSPSDRIQWFDNLTLEGEQLPKDNSPPIAIKDTVHMVMPVGFGVWHVYIDSLFIDEDNDRLNWHIVSQRQGLTHLGYSDMFFFVEPVSRGSNTIIVDATDDKSPPVFMSLELLHYPEAINLQEQNLEFREWSPDHPPFTYPENMLFMQSKKTDPGLDDEMMYGYDVWEGDYEPEHPTIIGFPYKLTQSTRINGLEDEGISLINSSSNRDLGAVVAAISTLNLENVWVQFKAGTLALNSKSYNLRLQYSIGPEGEWQDFDENQPIEYIGSSHVGSVQQFQNIKLPDAALNQEYVLVRWKFYYTGVQIDMSSELGDMIQIDDIIISKREFKSPTFIISPMDGETDVLRNPVLMWTDSDPNATYQIQLRKASAKSDWSIELEAIGTNTIIITEPLESYTKYEWRVRRFDDVAESEWSPINNFTTGLIINTRISESTELPLRIFPNPLQEDELYFNKPASGWIYQLDGKPILHFERSEKIILKGLQSGTYLLKSDAGESCTLIILPRP